jgi:hypothetical protein
MWYALENTLLQTVSRKPAATITAVFVPCAVRAKALGRNWRPWASGHGVDPRHVDGTYLTEPPSAP